jgi:hypothetical protein
MIDELLRKHSVIGIAGNRSTGKTSLALTLLLELKEKYPSLSVSVMGVEDSLTPVLEKKGIKTLHSKMDILDLRMRDTVIYVAEFALFFDSRNKNKQLDKLMRFFDRIEHNNCKLIIDTAREGYFNKFFCSRVGAFLIKQIEYDSLVNGTWLKERVKSIRSVSDYRLECDVSQYYVVTTDGDPTTENTFPYNPLVDSKKTNKDLFDTTKTRAKKNA